MKANPDQDTILLREIRLKNLLSFGLETVALPLERLNVFIGPNGSGKSNLIEALALMRATPDADIRSVVRRGGGAEEWIWKGAQGEAASVELVVHYPKGKQPLRHLFAFRADAQGFRLDDERVKNLEPFPGQTGVYIYYKFQGGHPVVNIVVQPDTTPALAIRETTEKHPGPGEPRRRDRKLARESVDLDVSILAQRRDPEMYPEITYLADTYKKWRIYREWAFGRNTVFREPQRADMRNDRLEEDFANLGLFLSRLQKAPKAKKEIVDGMQDLYDGFADFEPIVASGSVQIFVTEGDFSIPATRLSDGTLRYLCLLAILCDPDPPPLICLEEPELGLHPDILPRLADKLVAASQRTQIIVTTHSDILVDAMTERPETIVVCEKQNGQTVMKRLRREDLVQWLAQYRLGQLWTKGQIGGTRW